MARYLKPSDEVYYPEQSAEKYNGASPGRMPDDYIRKFKDLIEKQQIEDEWEKSGYGYENLAKIRKKFRKKREEKELKEKKASASLLEQEKNENKN